jgi:Protein of unknown function (DUF3102)
MSSNLTIPDPDEIRTMRPIPKKEIIEVIRWDAELHDLRATVLKRAFEIGFRLTSWRGLVSHGKWLKWLSQNLPEIGERRSQQYIQLWEHHEWLEAKFKSETVSDLPDLPGIKDALVQIQQKNRKDRETLNRVSDARPRTKDKSIRTLPADPFEVEVKVESNVDVSSPATPGPLHLAKIKPHNSDLIPSVQCCPTCGRPLPEAKIAFLTECNAK